MANLPQTYPLTAYRGDTWAQTFRLIQDGSPADLEGATVASWIRKTPSADPIHLKCERGAGDGEVTIGWPDGDPVDAGKYDYDVQVTSADGTVTTWAKGKLTVEQDVTQSGA